MKSLSETEAKPPDKITALYLEASHLYERTINHKWRPN